MSVPSAGTPETWKLPAMEERENVPVGSSFESLLRVLLPQQICHKHVKTCTYLFGLPDLQVKAWMAVTSPF